MQFIGKQISANEQSNNPFRVSKLKLAIHRVLICSSALLISAPVIALAEQAEDITLQEVNVVAPALSDTRPVKGYNAKKSSSSTRTDSELRDVPQAISVVTQDQIKDQSVQSIAEAVRYVPGVQASQGEGNRDALVFRGNQTTGDLFVDGMRDDVQTYRDFYNTDRIEVLKGPNGMAFGRGGAGGVVNRVMKEAGWDPISEVTASYGAYDQKRISADFGQALSEDIAFRINAVYENSDSYRNGYNLERYGVTPTLTIRPSDKTKIVLSAEYFEDKRTADRGVPSLTTVNGVASVTNPHLNRRPYKIGDTDAFYGSANLSPTETETLAFSALFDHSFNNGVNVKNRTRYANYNKYYQNVFADSPVGVNGNFTVRGYVDFTDRENLSNQTDLTYTAHWGQIEHQLLTGLELTTQDTDNSRLAAFFNNDFTANGTQITLNANNQTEIGSNIPVSFRANLENNNNPYRDNKSTVNVIGVYVQDQIKFSQQWQAIVGLRHDRFTTDFDGSRRRGGSVNPNDLISESFNTTDNLLSPRAGLIFKPVEPLSIYTNYSLSYVPRAGDQLTSLSATNKNADPEKFINYEIGAKWDISSNLSLTAAAYKLERQNVGVADPNNANGQILLIDGQETKGFELSISGNITGKWSIFGGYTYQDGEITKALPNSNANNVTAKGSDLALTPKHTFSLWNRYDINETWALALGVVSRSEMYAALPTVSQSTLLPGYTRYDAALFARINKNTRFQLNLENLTNKEYALFAHNNQNITPGSPITGRATIVYNF